MFRLRFHFLEYNNERGARACVRTLFDELGIPPPDAEDEVKAFKFIRQTHRSKTEFQVDDNESVFDVIDKYNEEYRWLFMTHPTTSRMFYFVHKNFTREYCRNVKQRY